jgi:DNA-binding NarL/FixJ family response regulator
LWLETLVRIAEAAGVRVVGTSTRSQGGIELLESKQPDIFLLDLDRSGLDRGKAGSLLLAASEAGPTLDHRPLERSRSALRRALPCEGRRRLCAEDDRA